MATKKFDRICVDLVSRIPDQLQTAFTPGGGALPDGYLLPATTIINYVNRALHSFFGLYWDGIVAQKNSLRQFMKSFPELVKFSDALTLTTGNYVIASPHFDFKKLIGAVKSTDNVFIKVWDDDKYTVALSGEYAGLTATAANPAIIQVNNKLAIFPQNSSFQIKIHYIQQPLDPITGAWLTQNGTYDSPFADQWNTMIADHAELMYLKDAAQTK